MLFVDSKELQLLMESDSGGGDELAIGVATATDGRRYLQVEGNDPDGLQRLPRCTPTADRGGD